MVFPQLLCLFLEGNCWWEEAAGFVCLARFYQEQPGRSERADQKTSEKKHIVFVFRCVCFERASAWDHTSSQSPSNTDTRECILEYFKTSSEQKGCHFCFRWFQDMFFVLFPGTPGL
ncbi:MAG: uncharacterized protein A8A55_2321 [Amphiamblys sp. WSBS2006]|nr:MAG: uncharacterized protein A8A55_2321 [Amphiamblys sp. WSBS2006]